MILPRFAFLFLSLLVPLAASTRSKPTRPDTSDLGTYKGAIVTDAATGAVLFESNPDVVTPPASMTKLMTYAVLHDKLAAGALTLGTPVTVSAADSRIGGTQVYLKEKEVFTVEELVYALMIQSANDAAHALAIAAAGSAQAFVELMNAYAQRIGMKDTHFVDVHGLAAEGHYSSAYDMALLGRALIRDYPDTYAYNSIKELTVNGITQPNRNLLLWRDPSVDGIKTGHTSQAGYCIMNSAKRGDQRLITVIMGDVSEKQRATDSLALLNWGFRFFETHRLYEPGKVLATQKVWKGAQREVQLGVAAPLLVGVPRGRYEQLKPSMDVPKQLVAPIKQGQQIGTVKVSLDGKVIAQAPLVAVNAVEEGGFFRRLWDAFWMWWESV